MTLGTFPWHGSILRIAVDPKFCSKMSAPRTVQEIEAEANEVTDEVRVDRPLHMLVLVHSALGCSSSSPLILGFRHHSINSLPPLHACPVAPASAHAVHVCTRATRERERTLLQLGCIRGVHLSWCFSLYTDGGKLQHSHSLHTRLLRPPLPRPLSLSRQHEECAPWQTTPEMWVQVHWKS
jgi:hypothetical protein